jgi:alcohol dehydrogenase
VSFHAGAALGPWLEGLGEGPIILVAGASFDASAGAPSVLGAIEASGRRVIRVTTRGEPDVAIVDSIVERARDEGVCALIGVGGGSAMDAAKAASAMAREDGSVFDYLEGVGSRKLSGKRLPLALVPTTAGTGSEATRNAVLSHPGPPPVKRSLRHPCLVPDVAIIDVSFYITAPFEVARNSAMDALSQLLEAYVSLDANPLTDSLAERGIALAGLHLRRYADPSLRTEENCLGMAYAAFLSGGALANAGLGAVHGIAGPLGAITGAPHGALCASLLYPMTKLLAAECEAIGADIALAKLARAGWLLSGKEPEPKARLERGLRLLLDGILELKHRLSVPNLRSLGAGQAEIARAYAEGGAKRSPAPLCADAVLAAIAREEPIA